MIIFNLQLYQFVIAALCLVMIGFSIERFIRGDKNQTILKLLVRILVWGGMLTITLSPRIIYFLARFVGLEGEINAVILTGFLLTFLMIFKLLSVIERIEYQITLLTRREALKNIKAPKTKK